MIHIIYGEDTYRSRAHLQKLVSEYQEKFGASAEVHQFDASEASAADLAKIASGGSLFAAQKIIVVKRAFTGSDETDEILDSAAAHIDSQDTVFLFWDGVLDAKAKKVVDVLTKKGAKAVEFKAFTAGEMRRWVDEYARTHGIKLFPAHYAALAALGGDFWAVTNELEKIQLSGGAYTASAVDDERTIFDLGDFFFTARARALDFFLTLMAQGEDEFGIFSYLAGHNRSILSVASYVAKGSAVPSSAGVHPFVVKKAAAILQRVPAERIHDSYHRFFEEDFRIKIGLSRPRDSLISMMLS